MKKFKKIISEVTLPRESNDKSIKEDVAALRLKIDEIEKRLQKIENGNFDDKTANKVRGDLYKFINKFPGAYNLPSV